MLTMTPDLESAILDKYRVEVEHKIAEKERIKAEEKMRKEQRGRQRADIRQERHRVVKLPFFHFNIVFKINPYFKNTYFSRSKLF